MSQACEWVTKDLTSRFMSIRSMCNPPLQPRIARGKEKNSYFLERDDSHTLSDWHKRRNCSSWFTSFLLLYVLVAGRRAQKRCGKTDQRWSRLSSEEERKKKRRRKRREKRTKGRTGMNNCLVCAWLKFSNRHIKVKKYKSYKNLDKKEFTVCKFEWWRWSVSLPIFFNFYLSAYFAESSRE